MADLVEVVLRGIFVNNIVLVMFLGLCPMLGCSGWSRGALGMSKAVVFVMAIATPVTWGIYHLVLLPLGLQYLWIVAFVLVIASLVQLLEREIERRSPKLKKQLGAYLALIASNCAILGVALLDITFGYGPMEATVYGVSAGLGYSLVLLTVTGIREALNDVPKSLRGAPVAFLALGILSMAFTHYFNIFSV